MFFINIDYEINMDKAHILNLGEYLLIIINSDRISMENHLDNG